MQDSAGAVYPFCKQGKIQVRNCKSACVQQNNEVDHKNSKKLNMQL